VAQVADLRAPWPNYGPVRWVMASKDDSPFHSVKDLEAGHRAGTTIILVLTGYGKGELAHQSHGWPVQPDHVAADLLGATRWILERERER